MSRLHGERVEHARLEYLVVAQNSCIHELLDASVCEDAVDARSETVGAHGGSDECVLDEVGQLVVTLAVQSIDAAAISQMINWFTLPTDSLSICNGRAPT